MPNSDSIPRDLGVQPLDEVLKRLGLKNTDLVKASEDQLTHRMVAKGRKGRRLTLNARMKVLRALNAVQTSETFSINDLFNYS